MQMWLLDENLPLSLSQLLLQLGFANDTVHHRGWLEVKNGELLKLAVANGFVTLLTKDKLFAEAAAKSLKLFPTFAIVRISLVQKKEQEYLQDFEIEFQKNPIVPTPGEIIHWPS